MLPIHVAALVFGAILVAVTLRSVIRTFVLPRSAQDPIARVAFFWLLLPFAVAVRRARTFERRDALLAFFAPFALTCFPALALSLILGGYMMMFWALGVHGWHQALLLSGSSLLTLGFVVPPSFELALLAYSEAVIGLIMVALLISYLPVIYGSFSEREKEVSLLAVRIGTPPTATAAILRYYTGYGTDGLRELFATWETWFVRVAETHMTHAVLSLFRSPSPDRSWITSAGAVLDAAALSLSTLDVTLHAHPRICLDAGSGALHQLAAFLGVSGEKAVAELRAVQLTREQFDAACDELARGDVPLKADRDAAFAEFRALRGTYERPLLALAATLIAPPAPWSSDLVPAGFPWRLLRVRIHHGWRGSKRKAPAQPPSLE